jgi:hypothetical protein
MSHYLRPGLPIRGTVSETACGKKAFRCNWTQHFNSVTCKQCRQEVLGSAGIQQIGPRHD